MKQIFYENLMMVTADAFPEMEQLIEEINQSEKST